MVSVVTTIVLIIVADGVFTAILTRSVQSQWRRNPLQTQAPMIDVRHLRKTFTGKVVLEDVNFTVARGSVCVVMGSGSGKSTVLRHLIGAYKPDSGEIYLDGEEISHLSEPALERVRRKFGMLFQGGGALLNSLTVGENIALPIRHHTDLPDETIELMVKMKLELVGYA